jgi:hypothetical protein
MCFASWTTTYIQARKAEEMNMYASGSNQLYHLLHFGFSFWLLLFFIPRQMFESRSNDAMERFFVRFMCAICLYIFIGYALVITKLFEVLALVPILLLIIFRKYLRKDSGEVLDRTYTPAIARFYDLLEIGFRIRHFFDRYRNQVVALRKPEAWSGKIRNPNFIMGVCLVAVLSGAAYVRLYDCLTDPAPPSFDSYVALAMTKYMEARQLFPEGIYPGGSHIVMAMLHKFAAIDQLYVVRYTGPFLYVISTAGMYFVVSRWSGNKPAGLVAAATYGLFGGQFVEEWNRQSASLTLDIASIFVLPSLYFYDRYVRKGDKKDLWPAWCGCTISGLIHQLPLAYAGLGLGVLLAVSLMANFRAYRRRVWIAALSGIGALLASQAPLGYGYLIGQRVNNEVTDFVTGTVKVPFPELSAWDYATLAGIAVTLIAAFLTRSSRRSETPELFLAAFGLMSFLLYYAGPPLTNNEMLVGRVGSLKLIAVPICIGAGWATLWRMFGQWRLKRIIEMACTVGLLAGLTWHVGLAPIKWFKVEWSSNVEQYLKIASSHLPLTWMIVSNDQDYSLIYLNGYHMLLKDFVKMYNPAGPPLRRIGQTTDDKEIARDVFVYHEKNVFRIGYVQDGTALDQIYDQREQVNQEFERWLQKFEQVNGGVDIYYEDENLVIYHFQLPDPDQDKNTRIWGGKKTN